jgi:uncharacterized protein YdeI (YjbR/CyaY-like superfamily)
VVSLEPLRVSDRVEWCEWLDAHESDTREAWLAIKKKGSKRPGLSLGEAVEEAIAHGWIDSQMKPIDADEFMLHFTPRRRDSPWSLRNRKIAERLITEGCMTEAGLAQVEAAKRNGRWEIAYSSQEPPTIPAYLEAALKERGMFEKFKALSNSAQLQYIYWIADAKKPETRERRIDETIRRALTGA